MKKILSVLLALTFILSSFSIVFAEEATTDFVITSKGEITAYYGDEWVVVPEEINGIKVTKIGEKVFFDLGISDVYLPDGLKEIGKSAFEGCNIMSVDIPSTVTVIGDRAFANCQSLYTVFTGIDEKTVVGKDAFVGTGHLLVYVDCDVDLEAFETMFREAKGDSNFEIQLVHIESEYDDEGNVSCGYCGFVEELQGLPFADVSFDAWYYDSVDFAYHNKIINGKSETKFDPDASMTCAEAAKMAACISVIFKGEIPAHTSGPWYQPYLDYCYEYGIIGEGVVFDWNKPITRGEMAYIFSRCDPFEEWYVDINDVPPTDIPDVFDATPYATEIRKLYNKGIAVGDTNMRFHPSSNIKRSEAAAIVTRILDWNRRVELPKG